MPLLSANRVSGYVLHLCVAILTGTDVLNQRAALGYRMKQVASVLRKWAGLRHPGLATDAIPVLDEIRTKGPETGVAVMTLDPTLGPFSPIDLQCQN